MAAAQIPLEAADVAVQYDIIQEDLVRAFLTALGQGDHAAKLCDPKPKRTPRTSPGVHRPSSGAR